MFNTIVGLVKTLEFLKCKCALLFLIILSLSHLMCLGQTGSSNACFLEGEWLVEELNVSSASTVVNSLPLPEEVDRVIGIQLRVREDLFTQSGTPLFSINTQGSWLFGGVTPNATTLEEDGEGYRWIRWILPQGQNRIGQGKVLALDFSATFPNGLSEDALRSLIGGGCIIILVDVI